MINFLLNSSKKSDFALICNPVFLLKEVAWHFHIGKSPPYVLCFFVQATPLSFGFPVAAHLIMTYAREIVFSMIIFIFGMRIPNQTLLPKSNGFYSCCRIEISEELSSVTFDASISSLNLVTDSPTGRGLSGCEDCSSLLEVE